MEKLRRIHMSRQSVNREETLRNVKQHFFVFSLKKYTKMWEILPILGKLHGRWLYKISMSVNIKNYYGDYVATMRKL